MEHNGVYYTSNLLSRIQSDVDLIQACSGVEHNRLEPEHLEEVFSAIASYPAGVARAGGGKDANENAVFLSVWWYTFPVGKWVSWGVNFCKTSDCSRRCEINVDPDSRCTARDYIYSECYHHNHRLYASKLRLLGVALPKSRIYSVLWTLPEFQIASVIAGGACWVLTPVGVFIVRPWSSSNPIHAVAEVTGVDLTQCRMGWEEVEPFFVMAALKGDV